MLGGFELKNVSKKNWLVMRKGNTISLVPGASVALKKNMAIDFGGANAGILPNSQGGIGYVVE
jgi:hypothetical protein